MRFDFIWSVCRGRAPKNFIDVPCRAILRSDRGDIHRAKYTETMASLVAQVVDGYNRIWDLRGELLRWCLDWSKLKLMFRFKDPRVEGWLFLSSPLPTLLMCLSYVLLVKVIGPAYMKNRPAFEFRNTLVVYNFFQVIFSAWLFYEVPSVAETIRRPLNESSRRAFAFTVSRNSRIHLAVNERTDVEAVRRPVADPLFFPSG